MSQEQQPTVVVLAAGKARRFRDAAEEPGRGVGEPAVLEATLAQVKASALPVVLVIPRAFLARASRLLPAQDIVALSDEQAQRGVGTLIAAGIVERAASPGWLILPADMARVQPRSLRAVASALRMHPVVYAQHRGQRGHLVGFAGELFAELAALSGREGARRIVARYPVHGEEVNDPGVLIDAGQAERLRQA